MRHVAVVGAVDIGGILAAAAYEAGNDVTVCVKLLDNAAVDPITALTLLALDGGR